jgi:hypothetical protein
MILNEPKNPDDGITVFYEGYGSFGTELQIHCNPRNDELGYFGIAYNVEYVSGISGANYSFWANSSFVCPMSYIESQIPSASPSPQPEQQINEELLRIRFGDNFSLDLELFQETVYPIIVGIDGFFEKVNIKISVGSRSGCISQYSCPYEDANIWKCWESTKEKICVPIGDFRYGLTVNAVDDDDLSLGVRLRYTGGLGGYETELILMCDNELTESEIRLTSIGRQILPFTLITIYGYSSQVCDGHILLWRSGPTIGGLFIFMIHTIGVIYLFVAVIGVVCREGQIKLPTRRFWRRFRLSVICSLRFISCRPPQLIREPSESCEALTDISALAERIG